jgi:hypothetical protein
MLEEWRIHLEAEVDCLIRLKRVKELADLLKMELSMPIDRDWIDIVKSIVDARQNQPIMSEILPCITATFHEINRREKQREKGMWSRLHLHKSEISK